MKDLSEYEEDGTCPGCGVTSECVCDVGEMRKEIDRLTARNRELDACHDALKELLSIIKDDQRSKGGRRR